MDLGRRLLEIEAGKVCVNLGIGEEVVGLAGLMIVFFCVLWHLARLNISRSSGATYSASGLKRNEVWARHVRPIQT